MSALIIPDRAKGGAVIRDVTVSAFEQIAKAVNDSTPLMQIYAAPAWDELSDDGKAWVMALVRETLAVGVERYL